jgi:hypothetical protein
LAFAIAGYHAGLPDGKELTIRLTKPLEPYDQWDNYTGPVPKMAELAESKMPQKNLEYPGFHSAFPTRMIFYCLVDSDLFETERFYAVIKGNFIERGDCILS